MTRKTIGIIGAGKLGITLAQLARQAGCDVLISGSGSPTKIALSVEVLAHGASAVTSEQVAQQSDIVILAIPLAKFRSLPALALRGKLVIDAINYWWEVDGPREDIIADNQSSSEAIEAFLGESYVVKAFNHIGYHELHDEARPTASTSRKAIALAGDDTAAVEKAAVIIDTLGFDPLPIGPLARGIILEPGHPAFGAHVTRDELRALLLEP